MKRAFNYGLFVLLCSVLLVTVLYNRHRALAAADDIDSLGLLLPDSMDAADPAVREWLDAAREEGLHLSIIRDSEFLNPMARRAQSVGLIVPDQVHTSANDALVSALYRYAREGGNLMIVYDACTRDPHGFYSKVESRLSALVGVSYGLYDKFGKDTMRSTPIWGSAAAMEELAIPPGKFEPRRHSRSSRVVAASLAESDSPRQRDLEYTLVGYQYGELQYPSFRTAGDFAGTVLLQSNNGVAAGYRRYGQGRVLFVNLPLSYLESRTDGLLMHSFLHLFAIRMASLPHLAAVPDGVGGLICNWHVDAQSAIKPLLQLKRAGIFDQGPYSIHLTAGPDVDAFNDHKGLNIANNREAQQLIHEFLRAGNAIGSHGGWIHNYFGENINDHNEKDFEPYLDLNTRALESVVGATINEYSAPVGNHPEWVTRWLEQHNFVAYYFTGDSGMAPTRVYRGGTRDSDSIWAFPIAQLGKDASLEEMKFDAVPEPHVAKWLDELTSFVADGHVARLVYTHPLGAVHYLDALQQWMKLTKQLSEQRRFCWYTMGKLAEFLNQREKVQWTLRRDHLSTVVMDASHPQSLAEQTWMFPASRYTHFRVLHGKAEIRQMDGFWFVTAEEGRHLVVEAIETD